MSHSSLETYGIQTGWHDPGTKTHITELTTFRQASITKTYVASTVLRVWGEDQLDLQSPIRKRTDPGFEQTLRNDGYDTDKILLIHFRTHTGGMFDSAEDENYLAALIAEPLPE